MSNRMMTVLKPTAGFENLYQGVPATTPLGLYPVTADGVIQNESGPGPYLSNLSRFAPCKIGSSLLLLFPRMRLQNGYTPPNVPGPIVETEYRYQLWWRMRTPLDFNNKRSKSFSLREYYGPYSSETIPVAAGLVIDPVMPTSWSDELPLYTTAQVESLGQGVFDPTYPTTTPNLAAAYGATYFNPVLVQCLGDEFTVTVTRKNTAAPANWDFQSASADGPLSNILGVNAAAPSLIPAWTEHDIYQGVGILAMSVTRNTFP